jgi:hypothetical protein
VAADATDAGAAKTKTPGPKGIAMNDYTHSGRRSYTGPRRLATITHKLASGSFRGIIHGCRTTMRISQQPTLQGERIEWHATEPRREGGRKFAGKAGTVPQAVEAIAEQRGRRR